MRGFPSLIGRIVLILSVAFAVWSVPAVESAAGPTAPNGPEFDDSTLLVGFDPWVPESDRDSVERDEDAVREGVSLAGTHLLRVGKGQAAAKIAALKRHSGVRFAELNYIVHAVDVIPLDASFGQLWGLQNTGQIVNGTSGRAGADIKAPAAWSVTTGTRSVVVGVVDTGIDYSHPDLATNVWTSGGQIGVCAAGTHGFNAITRTCDPMDDHYHGTHVAGTIGAQGNNSSGVVGVNWNTSIMGLKFLDSNGSGTLANAIAAIDYAIQAKRAGVNVRVLNNSWGGGGFTQALLDEINLAGQNDILFVAAAGNSATNNDLRAFYPCDYGAFAPSLICVAATDQNDNLASFSNFGASSVHLGAPGVNIFSTSPDGAYRYLSGTSMATPHVTGAAALILATGAYTTAALKGRILDNVDPLTGLSGKTTTGGRLNVCRSIPGCVVTAAPSAPRNLSAARAPRGSRGTRLSWIAPSSSGSGPITAYKVYRGTAKGQETLLATLGNVTSYADTATTSGVRYFYRVTATNAAGESPPSNEVNATAR